MADEPRRYLFHPVERQGLLLGLAAGQLAVVAAGCLLAVVTTHLVRGLVGLPVGVAVFVAAVIVSCWPLRGRSPLGWVPVVAGCWLASTRWRNDLPGQGRGPVVPADGWPPTSGRPFPTTGSEVVSGPGRHRRPMPAPLPPLAGVRLLELADDGLGLLDDRRAGTLSVVLAVEGRSFPLLEPADKQRRLAAFGAVLAGMGRSGSPVHRLQWLQRSVPGAGDGLLRYFSAHAVDEAESRASYRSLIAGAGPAAQDRRTFVVVTVHARRSARTIRTLGGGTAGAAALLRREARLLAGRLRRAELGVGPPLGAGEVASVVHRATQLAGPRSSSAGPDDPLARAVPMAAEATWSAYRTDDSWHATYWVADWPRVEVGPDFLSPLLLATGRVTVAVTMAPVPPERAAREAESARTAVVADEELRRRAGFLASARRRREGEGVTRRESELADGHLQYRYSGYVTVSGADQHGLEQACAEVEQVAGASQLRLRRLFGQQDQAFTWTLPLGRGLA